MLTKQNGCAIFLAGGSGKRMASRNDKILRRVYSAPVIAHSVRAFAVSGVASTAVFVCRDDVQRNAIQEIVEKENFRENFEKILFCQGGKERGDSVLSGLKCASATGVEAESLAFIHDGARPLIGPNLLQKLAEIAQREGAAVLAHRCVNTVRRVAVDALPEKACVAEDLERERLWEMETPQVFPLGKILSAYEKVAEKNLYFTDDVSVFCAAGGKVAFVENLLPNPKITMPLDLFVAEALLRKCATS